VLVVSVQDAGAGAPLQGVSRVEGPTDDPMGRCVEGGGEGEEPVYHPGPRRRHECSQAVLDFLSTTDVEG